MPAFDLPGEPILLIKDQAYVGGKSIRNTGGSVIDYLYASNMTGNVLMVEIKTPAADLLRSYRGNVLAPATDLSGGVQQLLQARNSFEEEHRQLVERSGENLKVVSPRCLLIVGNLTSLSDDIARRSFELFRNNNRQVEVVTFDELIGKAEQLVRLLEGELLARNWHPELPRREELGRTDQGRTGSKAFQSVGADAVDFKSQGTYSSHFRERLAPCSLRIRFTLLLLIAYSSTRASTVIPLWNSRTSSSASTTSRMHGFLHREVQGGVPASRALTGS